MKCGDEVRSVHWGINTPSKTPTPSFLPSPPPLNLRTAQAPLFRQFPLYTIIDFS